MAADIKLDNTFVEIIGETISFKEKENGTVNFEIKSKDRTLKLTDAGISLSGNELKDVKIDIRNESGKSTILMKNRSTVGETLTQVFDERGLRLPVPIERTQNLDGHGMIYISNYLGERTIILDGNNGTIYCSGGIEDIDTFYLHNPTVKKPQQDTPISNKDTYSKKVNRLLGTYNESVKKIDLLTKEVNDLKKQINK